MSATDDSTAIEEFTIPAAPDQIDDLQQRLAMTRWPEAEAVDDWSQGIPLRYVQELCEYWRTEYNWPERVALLNQWPQFRTMIDGLNVHLIHARSPHDDAMPLIMSHGWPGSIVEFQKVIGPLTNPTAHGGDAADAFHVVAPSLPGFGFSDKPASAGCGVGTIAHMWAALMARLGYERYGAQGGDWGSAVSTALAGQDAEHCAGVHLNMPVGRPDPETMNDLTGIEQQAIASMTHYVENEAGYSTQQRTKPQTLGYGLVDSPAAQAAWIIEKFHGWTDNNGHPEDAISRDELLDNVMMYWLPATGASSARIYWESFGSFGAGEVEIPMGASLFPKEIVRTSQRWAQKHYKNIVYWNHTDRGGHFAAFEVPDIFVEEVRKFFRLVR